MTDTALLYIRNLLNPDVSSSSRCEHVLQCKLKLNYNICVNAVILSSHLLVP